MPSADALDLAKASAVPDKANAYLSCPGSPADSGEARRFVEDLAEDLHWVLKEPCSEVGTRKIYWGAKDKNGLYLKSF